jgi:hypothetical protein
MRTGRLGVGHRPDARQVLAQGGGTVEVDVGDVGARQVGLHVRQHPDHPGHRPRDLELAGAQERHLAEPQPSRGVGGELGDQVGGRGEDDGDEVVDLEPVGAHHVEDHLGDPLEHVVAVVCLELGGATHRSDSHADPFLLRPPGERRPPENGNGPRQRRGRK